MDDLLSAEDQLPWGAFQYCLDLAQRHAGLGDQARATECFIRAHWLAGTSRDLLWRLEESLQRTGRAEQAATVGRILRAVE
ncbi:MAG: hypothetical protein K0Q72_3744 [Armatimonadetes bacterium]|nr:hypothetical protein [Armatimonadota bacterium]